MSNDPWGASDREYEDKVLSGKIRDISRGKFFVIQNALLLDTKYRQRKFRFVISKTKNCMIDDTAPFRTRLAVYSALALRTNKRQQCWPSQNTIAQDSGLNEISVRRALRDLEYLGLISIETRAKGSNRYTLLDIPDYEEDF